MTAAEAHAIVQKEVAKRVRRKQRGKWGARNAAILKADRAAVTLLKEHPYTFARTVRRAYAGRRLLPCGDGCYRRGSGRRPSLREEIE